MELTLDDLHHKDRFQTTGHIGAHRQSPNQSFGDGKDTLDELASLLTSLDINVSVLDGTRRYLRPEQARLWSFASMCSHIEITYRSICRQ